MKGTDLIRHLSRKLKPAGRRKPLARNELASRLGMSGPALWNWLRRRKDLTPAQVSNLVSKAMRQAHELAEREAIKPIVEFFGISKAESKGGKKFELIAPADAKDHPYLSGLKQELRKHHGVYIFYDSRGRALYAGKALKRSLWNEMKSAFNRDRDVQNVKRVKHPQTRREFRTSDEKQRQIRQQNVALHGLANYVSAYAVPPGFINTLEAVLIRGFANDLLDARMERFARPQRKKRRKRRSR